MVTDNTLPLLSIVRLLLSHPLIDINIKSAFGDQTIHRLLHNFNHYSFLSEYILKELLLRPDIQLNEETPQNFTPLIEAAYYSLRDAQQELNEKYPRSSIKAVLHLLADNRIDVNKSNGRGETFLSDFEFDYISNYTEEQRSDIFDLLETIVGMSRLVFDGKTDATGKTIVEYIRNKLRCENVLEPFENKRCKLLKINLEKRLAPTSDAARALSRTIEGRRNWSDITAEHPLWSDINPMPKLPSTVWEYILRVNEHASLCKLLDNEENIVKVQALAVIYGIPLYLLEADGVSATHLERVLSKTELCHRIAFAMKNGRWTPETNLQFMTLMQTTDTRFRQILDEIKQLAYTAGLNPNDPNLQQKLQNLISQ